MTTQEFKDISLYDFNEYLVKKHALVYISYFEFHVYTSRKMEGLYAMPFNSLFHHTILIKSPRNIHRIISVFSDYLLSDQKRELLKTLT